jgi:hypothetical protein
MSICTGFSVFKEDFNVRRELLTMDEVDFDVHRELLRTDWKEVEGANIDLGYDFPIKLEYTTTPAEEKLLNWQSGAFIQQNHIVQILIDRVMGRNGHFYKILKYIELLAQEAYMMRLKNKKDFSRIESSILEQKNMILEQKKIIVKQEKMIFVMGLKLGITL